MPIDPTTGIYTYDTSDGASAAVVALLNKLANSVKDAVATLQARMTAQEKNGRASYREFALTRSLVADSVDRFLVPTHDASVASPNAFQYVALTGSDDGGLQLEAGYYSISALANLGGNVTAGNRAVVDMVTGLTGNPAGDQAGGTLLARANIPPGASTATAATGLRLTGTEKIWIRVWKNTGATTTVSGRLRIARLSGL